MTSIFPPTATAPSVAASHSRNQTARGIEVSRLRFVPSADSAPTSRTRRTPDSRSSQVIPYAPTIWAPTGGVAADGVYRAAHEQDGDHAVGPAEPGQQHPEQEERHPQHGHAVPELDEPGRAETEQARPDVPGERNEDAAQAPARSHAGGTGRVRVQRDPADPAEQQRPQHRVSAFVRHDRAMADDLPAHIHGHRAERHQPDHRGRRAGQRGLRQTHALDGKAPVSGCPSLRN